MKDTDFRTGQALAGVASEDDLATVDGTLAGAALAILRHAAGTAAARSSLEVAVRHAAAERAENAAHAEQIASHLRQLPEVPQADRTALAAALGGLLRGVDAQQGGGE